jgi:hypothetical protein
MRTSNKGRTIVIGVDSMDLLLIERWAAAGYLPFFAAQLRDCSLVRLSTPTAVLQGALWPDLIAGRSPGHHGTYFLTQLTNGTYDLDRIRADRINAVPYYGFLDAHGVRCAVVDFPHVMPIQGFRGLHIVDWLSEFQTWQFTVQPPEHEQDLVNRFGILKPTGGYGATGNSLDGHRELRRKLEATVQMKTALVKELLGRDDLTISAWFMLKRTKQGTSFGSTWTQLIPTTLPWSHICRMGCVISTNCSTHTSGRWRNRLRNATTSFYSPSTACKPTTGVTSSYCPYWSGSVCMHRHTTHKIMGVRVRSSHGDSDQPAAGSGPRCIES